MSQIPPLEPRGITPSYGYAPQAPRTSAAAVTSLVCGILGCMPLLTSIAAIITAIFGLRATRNPMVGGRGLAIAGLILGIVGLCGWTLLGGSWWIFSQPERALAHHFIDDLAQGNSTAAARQCTARVSAAQLSAAIQQLQAWGSVKGTTIFYVNISTTNSVASGSISGTITTPNGAHQFQIQTVDQNGIWKIDSFTLQ